MKTFILFVVTTLFLASAVQAHALWIETNPAGKKGIKQEVKIFYGEYSENSPEKIADWYSDVKDFTIWLVSPGGDKVKLAVNPIENHFTSSFTPESDGVYTLVISHDAKKLAGKTKYQFNASATVKVGSGKLDALASNENPLKFSYDQNTVNKPIIVNAVYKGVPAEKFQTTVFSPKGWTLQLPGKNGLAQFKPEWKGRYMIEISNSYEEKGEHHGEAFETVWRCATSLVDIN
jgi:hypothetical protein